MSHIAWAYFDSEIDFFVTNNRYVDKQLT